CSLAVKAASAEVPDSSTKPRAAPERNLRNMVTWPRLCDVNIQCLPDRFTFQLIPSYSCARTRRSLVHPLEREQVAQEWDRNQHFCAQARYLFGISHPQSSPWSFPCYLQTNTR